MEQSMHDEPVGEPVEANAYEEIYMIAKKEIDNFNYFLKHHGFNKEKNINVVWAIASTVKFLLMQPVTKFNDDINVFNLKRVRFSGELIPCLKFHLPLFNEFDSVSVPQRSWAINSMNKKIVQLVVKIETGGEEIFKKMESAVKIARSGGWNGSLEILTRSTKKIVFT